MTVTSIFASQGTMTKQGKLKTPRWIGYLVKQAIRCRHLVFGAIAAIAVIWFVGEFTTLGGQWRKLTEQQMSLASLIQQREKWQEKSMQIDRVLQSGQFKTRQEARTALANQIERSAQKSGANVETSSFIYLTTQEIFQQDAIDDFKIESCQVTVTGNKQQIDQWVDSVHGNKQGFIWVDQLTFNLTFDGAECQALLKIAFWDAEKAKAGEKRLADASAKN